MLAQKFIITATCLDCGAPRNVSSLELNRAARPRCLKCGGPIEVSDAGRDQLAAGHEAQHLLRECRKSRTRPRFAY
jgi:hypothetical protein